MIPQLWMWLVLAMAPCGAPVACKCAEPSIEESYARSEAVFRGVVLEIGEPVSERLSEGTVTPLPPDANGMPGALVTGGTFTLPVEPVTFRVTGRWKGARADTLVVGNLYFCGVAFEPGREYLVYATRGEDGKLGTNFCLRTRVMDRDPRLIYQAGVEDVPVLDRLARARRPRSRAQG